MHKELLLATTLIMLASVIGGCSLKHRESNSNTVLDSLIVSSSSSNDSTDTAKNPPIPYEEMLQEIAGLSRQTGIGNLKEAKISDSETEIRIWREGGTSLPVCFVLRLQNDSPIAFLVGPKVLGDKAVFDKKGSARFVKTVLQSRAPGGTN